MSRGEWLGHLKAEPDYPRVLIVDEVDQLESKKILYDFAECPGLGLVLIANDSEGLWAGMSGRTESRLLIGTRIEFDAYSVSQLTEILKKRVENASIRSAVTDRQLETIATAARGDARISIMALSYALDEARKFSGATDITDGEIDGAAEAARERLRKRHRKRLNDFQEELLGLLEEHGPAGKTELHEIYSDTVESPKSKRTVGTHLRKMVDYEVLGERGVSQNKQYFVK